MATQQEIAQNYQNLFGRTADPEGAAYWQSTGLSGQALINAMLGGAQGKDITYAQQHPYTPVSQQATQTTQSQQTTPSSYTFNLGNTAAPATSSNFDTTSPYVQAALATQQANVAGAQAATAANRVNQVTPYGGLQYQQTGVDAQGNPIWSATQTLAPQFQTALGNIGQNVAETTAQGFNPTNLPSVGINPGETYSDAIMRRLQPQQAQQAKGLEAQLANQGIMPGSEAYNRAKTQLAQAQNDQLTSAIVGGFNTGLAANQQAYQQAATNYQMPLATLNQFKTATTPSYVNPYNQAAVSGPDYLGAYTTSQNAQLAAQNAANANQSNLYSGLLGLGSSAIMNPTGVVNLAGAIGSGLNTIGNAASGLFSGASNLFGGSSS